MLFLVPIGAAVGLYVEITAYQNGTDNVPVKGLSIVPAILLCLWLVIAHVRHVREQRLERLASTPSSLQEAIRDDVSLFDILGIGFHATVTGMVVALVGTLVAPQGRAWTSERYRRMRHRR